MSVQLFLENASNQAIDRRVLEKRQEETGQINLPAEDLSQEEIKERIAAGSKGPNDPGHTDHSDQTD